MGSEISAVSADWTPDPILNSAESIATRWKARLLVGKRGGALGNVANALTALRYAPEWQGVLHFNESSLATVAKATPPFERTPAIPFDWAEEHDILTAAWLQHQAISVNKEIAGQALQVVAREHSFHPVRDYLDSLKWDGYQPTKRLADFVPWSRPIRLRAGRRLRSSSIAGVARYIVRASRWTHVPFSKGSKACRNPRPCGCSLATTFSVTISIIKGSFSK